VEAARAALDLARASQVTDITWGGGVNHYPPDQRASVQLRAQFPWQLNYRFEGEIRQAVAVLQRAEASLSQTTVAAESELTSLHLRRIATAARLDSIETRILERSREVLERAEAAYARGATSLTDLLDARRTFRAVRLDAVQARLDAARADTEWRLRSLSVVP
jgi:cobalt-zinc-cadmium efflux system outer membrane protein